MATVQGPRFAATEASLRLSDGPAACLDAFERCSPFAAAEMPPFQAQPALPNPPFTFPARLPVSEAVTAHSSTASSPLSTLPASSGLTDRRGERPRMSPTLPTFNFNPGAALPVDSNKVLSESPPKSPSRPAFIPSPRSGGHRHRRGGSEFIGGSIREGNSIAVISTSPTRVENGVEISGLAPSRRGHRRGVSGTVSTNDLSSLQSLAGSALPRGSSAPNSPTQHAALKNYSPSSPDLASPTEEPQDFHFSSPRSISPQNQITTRSALRSLVLRQARVGRSRVGFSDTLEFIPRPVSLVSSDTSSTVTARPGHSATCSMSSIVSSTPSVACQSRPFQPQTVSISESQTRPSTADARVGNLNRHEESSSRITDLRRWRSTTALSDTSNRRIARLTELGGPVKTLPTWHSLLDLQRCNENYPVSPSFNTSDVGVPHASPDSPTSDVSASRTAGERAFASPPTKKGSKKKRVMGWADSILPRRPRCHAKTSMLADVPPPTPSTPEALAEGDAQDIVAPEVSEIGTPATIHGKRDGPVAERLTQERDDASLAMIDLDAALGPFNTPLPRNPEWEAAQRAAGYHGKRRMYSALGMKGFSGPGMHYHRRAESAPDLPPFELGRSGMPRFSSNATMADVFEEDEDVAVDGASDGHGSASPALTEKACPSDDGRMTCGDDRPVPRTSTTEVAACPRSDDFRGNSQTDDHDIGTRQAWHENEVTMPLSRETAEKYVDSTAADDINEPAIESSLVSRSSKHGSTVKELEPLDIDSTYLYNRATTPASPYSTSHASSFPSPRSLLSMDTQRLPTAPSSIADKHSFQSLLMGEPGPEVRISVDFDVPSLSSSISTKTLDSSFSPNARISQPNLRDKRPLSMSSAFGRRRSSLVSLSRLISSSYGERSKLSMEVTHENDAEQKLPLPRGKRTKQRLSHMVQFWKPNKDEHQHDR